MWLHRVLMALGSLATALLLLAGVVPSSPAGADPASGTGAAPAGSTQVVPAAVSTATGPDVSAWNHPGGAAIDWNQVAGSGQSFAFIKATEGASAPGSPFYTNPWFASDWSAAGAAGLFRGAYDFARPALPITTAQTEASAYVSVAGTMRGTHDLPPVLDLEVTGGLSPSDLTAWTQAWLSTAQNLTGRLPVLYTSPNFEATALGGTTSLAAFRLWEASWTAASTPGSVPGWGSRWTFWQYTDAASVPGITGGVDLSRFNGSQLQLQNVAGAEVPITGPQLYLRNSVTSGVADTSYRFGAPAGGTPLMCDWDGNGTATPGVFVNGNWYITNSSLGGFATQSFGYGDPGDIPVCGDWDGNGTQTPGVVRNGNWYLSNSVGVPVADMAFGYGNPGDLPVVGDWNGDGRDTPGMFRTGNWYLVNSLGKPTADLAFGYGNPGDLPVVGDWNNDGRDTPGIVRDGSWYVVNALGAPVADMSFGFGDPSDTPLTGRWVAGQAPTIGISR
jgi:GH25 family lysozyme M1 (1,4-beta-N-acetylmuramidase)